MTDFRDADHDPERCPGCRPLVFDPATGGANHFLTAEAGKAFDAATPEQRRAWHRVICLKLARSDRRHPRERDRQGAAEKDSELMNENGKPFVFDRLTLVFEPRDKLWVCRMVDRESREEIAVIGSIAKAVVEKSEKVYGAFVDLMQVCAAMVIREATPGADLHFGEPVAGSPENGQGSP